MKNKKFFVFAVLTFAALGGLTVFTQVNKTNTFVSAEECDHHHVEHYVGYANRDFAGTSGGYVDHYACCGCHTVWADEARTIVLGQSTADRAKIDLRNITSYKFQWDYTGVPHYSEEHGVVYESTLLNAFDGNGGLYIETVSDFIDEELYSTVTFEFTNNTKFDLDVRVMDIDAAAGSILFVRKTVVSGETTTFSLTSEQYNTVSSSPDDGTKNGFNLWFTGTDAATISSSDKISISVPKFNSKTDPVQHTNNITGQNYPTEGSWGPIPHEKGVYTLKASYGAQYFDPRTAIPDWATLFLNFENPTDTSATVSFGYVVTDTVVVPAHGSATLDIPASIWNAPVGGETDKIRLSIVGAEELKLSMHYKLDTTEKDFLAELDAITLSDITANGSYHADFVTKLKPVLDRINAHYNGAVPAAIKNHKNYLDYVTASTFTVWDYGTPTISTTTVDGVEYMKITAAASEKKEQGVITRQFHHLSGASKLVFRVYNPCASEIKVVGHAGYDAWLAGGETTLPAQKWSTLTFDKTKYASSNQFALIFINVTEGDEILVSPIVDYKVANELQGTVVWAGVVTERGYGWAAMPSTPTKYGDAYTSQNTNSATEDPEWKCTDFYLNNTTTVDAETYSYVKFYAYNLTDQPLFVALRGASGQYHFDESGNSLAQKEWKEFLIPVEKWNDNKDGNLELLFSSGEHHTGTIIVSRFVGVTK